MTEGSTQDLSGRLPGILRLRAPSAAIALGVAGILCLGVQAGLGASTLVLAATAAAVVLGLVTFAVLGGENGGSWTVLFYVLGNVLIALYAKTVLGQRLDSYLYAPTDAFLILLVATATMVAALFFVHLLPLGRGILRPLRNVRTLRRMSWSCFGAGVVFWFVNHFLHGPSGAGVGGFAVLRSLMFMGVISRTAMLLEESADRRTFDWKLGIMIAVAVALGVLTDTKTQAAYPVVAYFATVLFFRRGLPWKQVLMVTTGGVVFVFLVAPLIHAWRYLGAEDLSLGSRVQLVEKAVVRATTGGGFQHYVTLSQRALSTGYYNYFGAAEGGRRGQMLLGRYASVQQVDPVIAEVQQQGELGGGVVWPALERLLPGFIDPDKPTRIEGYEILSRLGLIDPRGGKFPTVPLAAQAYAAYGVAGVALIPFFTFLVFFAAFKLLGWNLNRNIYGIFFFCQFVIVYAGQGTFGQYAGAALREFPLFAVIFITLQQVGRLRIRKTSGCRTGIWGR